MRLPCLVRVDAMGCQKAIASQIIKQQGDYLLALKGNQGKLHREVKAFFSIAQSENFTKVIHDAYEAVDAGHGRIETRRAYAIALKSYKKYFPSATECKKLTSIVMVESEREIGGHKSKETRFYLTSCQPSAKRLLAAVRKH